MGKWGAANSAIKVAARSGSQNIKEKEWDSLGEGERARERRRERGGAGGGESAGRGPERGSHVKTKCLSLAKRCEVGALGQIQNDQNNLWLIKSLIKEPDSLSKLF